MKILSKIYIVIFISLIMPNEYIDVLYLKNGSIIKGQIIENKINDYIKIELSGGSILIYKYNEISSIEIEKNEKLISDKNINFSNSVSSIDCFSKGYNIGNTESVGVLPLVSMLGGYGFGIIGWGVGFALVSGKTFPPYHNFDNEYKDCKKQDSFARGYQQGSKESRRRAVTFGSLIGWFIFLASADID
ncbi:MAG: hypothetical protein CMG14_01770 [Candidatus Marinimicrobia bacterium]|nr:hypothetical protein [Candidatus Neomarinimicrobiota bacterium]|tara:strand:+ start:61 stop:627 length:567 start_codon:yes stop_codon:yes gene_type:complete